MNHQQIWRIFIIQPIGTQFLRKIQIYFKDIIDLNRKEQLTKQQIPVEDESLWMFKNYDAFIKKRSENILKYANECLLKLEKPDWEEGIMDDDIDINFKKYSKSRKN